MPTTVTLPILDPDAQNTSAADSRVWNWDDPTDWHTFTAGQKQYVLVAAGSRVYGIDSETAADLARQSGGHASPEARLQQLGISSSDWGLEDVPDEPPIRSLSLAIAQKCNLGCTYCYAEGGSFGGAAKNMPQEVAMQAVNRLFDDVGPGERVNLAFLGGEPLFNREVLYAATEAAHRMAGERDIGIGFSVTTNGTLVNEEDGDFFERYGFAVTISLDGIEETHDRLRPYKSGRGSFAAVIERVAPMLRRQRRMQISARVTVTPQNLELRRTLDGLIELGFHSVGFSPMLSSPTGRDEMRNAELDAMLAQMIECGTEFERRVSADERYPFANIVNSLKEIHKGTHRPYPCGAGAGYLGVSAEGELFACHRFVDDPAGALGNLSDGVDGNRRRNWLTGRHVETQQPCNRCWARYLCGGGCHHEVIHRGRPACGFIRGWLHYCLQTYVRLLDQNPAWFGA